MTKVEFKPLTYWFLRNIKKEQCPWNKSFRNCRLKFVVINEYALYQIHYDMTSHCHCLVLSWIHVQNEYLWKHITFYHKSPLFLWLKLCTKKSIAKIIVPKHFVVFKFVLTHCLITFILFLSRIMAVVAFAIDDSLCFSFKNCSEWVSEWVSEWMNECACMLVCWILMSLFILYKRLIKC
jgi:hypothetical protein